MDALGVCDAAYRARLSDVHAEALYYVELSARAEAIARWWRDGDLRRVRAALAVAERGLRLGDPEAQNLVVVGLLESLMGFAYREAGAALEELMPPRVREAWSQLLCGWIAGEVLSVDRWRLVLVNRAVASVEVALAGEAKREHHAPDRACEAFERWFAEAFVRFDAERADVAREGTVVVRAKDATVTSIELLARDQESPDRYLARTVERRGDGRVLWLRLPTPAAP